MTEPVAFDPRALDQIRKVYVNHTQPRLASLQASFDYADAADWQTHQVASGHDLMLAAPAETAALLEAVAQQAP